MKKTAFILSILLVTLSLLGCSSLQNKKAQEPKEVDYSSLETKKQLAAALTKRLSLEEKIGQLMLVGINGSEPDSDSKTMLEDYHVGGVILFDRNMENKNQVRGLIDQLQADRSNKFKLPLFMAVDQEGGQVARMQWDMYRAPTAASIAAGGNPEEAYRHAYNIGTEVKALGFNIDFAPVLDINLNLGNRSYGTSADQVIKFAGEACRGFYDSGLIFSLKHFPGIGKSAVDPHIGEFSVQASRETLEKEDIAPFKAMLSKYPAEQLMVMVGHIKYAAYDNTTASLSPIIINGLLRDQLGYQGLVITDDLEMGAVTKAYGQREVGVKALEAGVDILLSCHRTESQQEIFAGVKEAVESGKLPQEVLDRAVNRVVLTKLSRLYTVEQLKELYENNAAFERAEKNSPGQNATTKNN